MPEKVIFDVQNYFSRLTHSGFGPAPTATLHENTLSFETGTDIPVSISLLQRNDLPKEHDVETGDLIAIKLSDIAAIDTRMFGNDPSGTFTPHIEVINEENVLICNSRLPGGEYIFPLIEGNWYALPMPLDAWSTNGTATPDNPNIPRQAVEAFQSSVYVMWVTPDGSNEPVLVMGNPGLIDNRKVVITVKNKELPDTTDEELNKAIENLNGPQASPLERFIGITPKEELPYSTHTERSGLRLNRGIEALGIALEQRAHQDGTAFMILNDESSRQFALACRIDPSGKTELTIARDPEMVINGGAVEYILNQTTTVDPSDLVLVVKEKPDGEGNTDKIAFVGIVKQEDRTSLSMLLDRLANENDPRKIQILSNAINNVVYQEPIIGSEPRPKNIPFGHAWADQSQLNTIRLRSNPRLFCEPTSRILVNIPNNPGWSGKATVFVLK